MIPAADFSGRRTNLIVFGTTILFLVVSLLAAKEQIFLVWIIPAGMIILILGLARIDLFYLLLLFMTPLSVQMRFIIPDPPFDMFLPTELMLSFLLLIMIFKVVKDKAIDRTLLRHPVSVLIIIMLSWSFITSLTGTMPGVSLKSFLARTWFVASFYFLGALLITDKRMIGRSFLALVAGMLPVIIYSIVRLQAAGLFNQQFAHIAAWPFFNDHTSFGATVAFLAPWTLWIGLKNRQAGSNLLSKPFSWLLFLAFMVALLFSYSRAAWGSAVVMLFLAAILGLKIPARGVFIVIALLAVFIFSIKDPIINRIESNRQDSSGSITEHVVSMTNITTDASNLERINRWKSAARMIWERPILGWGSGTYQFKYAPYQNSSERTIISTNFGDRGNAHSEYLGAAVDSGIPGGLIFILIAIATLWSGYRVWTRSGDRWVRLTALAAITGLTGYLAHALMNSFLDTDKLSAPFWLSIAVIVVLDLKEGGRKSGSVEYSSNN